MPSYKLYYFNARGLGEMIRLLFAEAGVEYEDVRYTREEWPKHKPDMLFNQMPVLFVDGEQIAHSRAAFRYLARKFNLDGGDEITAAKIDMWVEVIVEAFMKLPFAETDEEKKKELGAIAMKDFIMPKLVKLEAFIASNGGPYVFGKDVTALDLFIDAILSTLRSRAGEQFLENLPKVKATMAAVEGRPKIAEWIKKRPETEH